MSCDEVVGARDSELSMLTVLAIVFVVVLTFAALGQILKASSR